VAGVLREYDVVFGNLESPLSDQGGETVSPRNGMIFTGPPQGAVSLARAGVTVVSTANNHALDYGVAAAAETRRNLDAAGVVHAGTGGADEDLFRPAVLELCGVRIAVFACSALMNRSGNGWKRYVAAADTGRLLPAIRAVRDSVDLVIVSYHGGMEYVDVPGRATRHFAGAVLSGGADLFLGHHSHVPQGIATVDGKLAVWSLGNFVFRQPFQEWTQRSFGFAADIVKDSAGTRLEDVRFLPLLAGSQPRFLTHEPEAERVLVRLRNLSSREVVERWLCIDTDSSSSSLASDLARPDVAPAAK
jgi:poly-gamma-glutamate capsule biosynthesis protein CapA/YwtB (metallophosphatase superfamily)